ncbi:WD40-repeat-containing domain protein [Phaeosphaeria sp. MPI-PUGE-AT-0046c]|nr:WD40-repeat-containing domain protein [Phaeosphaeria sp. MPI-PUGE-AT-0046c]
MSPSLHHECTRLPVTALTSCGVLFVAAEGPFLHFYHAKNSRKVASKRVFKAQAVHGLSVYSETYDDVIKLVIWGGCLIRALEVSFAPEDAHKTNPIFCLSEIARASDWILDLAPRFSSLEDAAEGHDGICVAATAHNALVHITIHREDMDGGANSIFGISVRELTSGSRSILYSAHVFWESEDCVLVAAGTAFGEIMYWSWNNDATMGAISQVHRVFLGHEGSVFGVRISKELPSDCCQSLKRVIASCSDDRTIRIWDVSDVTIRAPRTGSSNQSRDAERTHHTGFSNAAFDPDLLSSSQCLAIGWGHASRVWKVQFLESRPCEGALFLVSAGEDASARTWKLSPNPVGGDTLPYQLIEQNFAAHHSGKNIWSCSVYDKGAGQQYVACGAADAKITTSPLVRTSAGSKEIRFQENTILDILSLAQVYDQSTSSDTPAQTHKPSKKADFFRRYCFLDRESFLLTTNSGSILVGSLQTSTAVEGANTLTKASFVDQIQDLAGYSICASDVTSGVAFVAGSTGIIYIYASVTNTLSKLCSLDGKIGEMFAKRVPQSDGRHSIALLATLVGKKEALLLYVNTANKSAPCIDQTVVVPLSEVLSSSMITAMSLNTTQGSSFLHLGFRRGSIATYTITHVESESTIQANLLRLIEKVHGDEAVTALEWQPSSTDTAIGCLASVGRDGCLAIQHMDSNTNDVELVHSLTLPIGPNVEGLYLQNNHLMVHGFSSKKWVLYDVTAEEEIMGVETGGAHRSWAFQPERNTGRGGTLVWTRASTLQICNQRDANHDVIRRGGHGREIKAVAVSNGRYGQLIATGAEDTDVKIFKYVDGELLCERTLRQHTTGIQHLQWSPDGEYLFSSGGCEEFYIWRIRQIPSAMGIGIVCEFIYAPESEHADLRIMSFDVSQHDTGYDIALVFSDSSIKVYKYTPTASVKWQPLAKGLYFTSCLTECLFLSPDSILTAGTDGHTVTWPLSAEPRRPTGSSREALSMEWQEPVRIHQSSSKSMASCRLDDTTRLVVSGGDDGSLAILSTWSASSTNSVHAAAPLLLNRTHASAVTTCAISTHKDRILILTSGNDQWVRLWEVHVRLGLGNTAASTVASRYGEGFIEVERLGKIKTNVADVSSMAVLESEKTDGHARVLICGVGMEVVRLELDSGISS